MSEVWQQQDGQPKDGSEQGSAEWGDMVVTQSCCDVLGRHHNRSDQEGVTCEAVKSMNSNWVHEDHLLVF